MSDVIVLRELTPEAADAVRSACTPVISAATIHRI
jgi:hypothetical protein